MSVTVEFKVGLLLQGELLAKRGTSPITFLGH
jgi:hypothetical protein